MYARLFAATGALASPLTVASYDFCGLLGLPLDLEQHSDHRPRTDSFRIALGDAFEFGARFIDALLPHVQLRQHLVADAETRIHGYGAAERLLLLGLIARGTVRSSEQR